MYLEKKGIMTNHVYVIPLSELRPFDNVHVPFENRPSQQSYSTPMEKLNLTLAT